MQIEDEPEIGLTKWPFYLGDGLLVATALAIAILGDWQLSDWQVVSCVLAVALGAGLFVLPYIVEFHVLAQENSDGSAAELKILRRQIQLAEDGMERAAVRIHQLEETLAAQVQSAEVVSEVMDGKFKKLEAALAQSAGELSALAQRLDALSEVPAESSDEPLQAVRQQLEEVQAQLQQRADVSVLEQFSQRLDRLQQAVASAAKTAASVAPEAAAAPEQRAAQTRLLQRAIPPQPAAAAAAVSRIISPRPKPELEELDDDEDEADLVVEETERELTGGFSFEELADLPQAAAKPKPAPKKAAVKKAVAKAPPQAEAAPAVAVAEVASEAPDPETQSAPAPEAAPAPKPAVKAQADLFAETVPVPSPRRARRQKTDSVVTASVLIGIGNKPYLRGSGGGLNWETGVVMDFEEIGKWGWLAPADLEAPIEFQIFCNDTDPDRKGKHRLEPGQKLEITPVF